MKITDDTIKGLCSDMVYKRGMEYFSEGRVHIKKRSEKELSAAVDGEELYNVYITFKDGEISSELCTCAYYETMKSPCKHIIAVLKQRQAELEAGDLIENENDRIAKIICNEYSYKGIREKIHAAFELYIKPNRGGSPEYAMSLILPELGGRVEGLEHFLDCYLNYSEFKTSRTQAYSRHKMYFSEHEDSIIKIMAEGYQTRALGVNLYRKSTEHTMFGTSAVRRILPHLKYVDFKIIYDGLTLNNVRILKENPDILIDIEAYGKDIVMSLSESGFSITPNGEWFLYNDTIYNTTPLWRDYFMPIYRSLSGASRTQITFRNNNAMLFAANILPKIKNCHGVVINGVDEIVVNDEPEFCVCLDVSEGDILAVPSAKYGTMQFKLPSSDTENNDKIIIRKYELEENLLALLNGFDYKNGVYTLSGDYEIYDFLTQGITELEKYSEIVTTDKFKDLRILDDFNLKVKATFNEPLDYLEIGFESDLTGDEISAMMEAMNLNLPYYRMKNGNYLDMRENRKKDILELLNNLGVRAEDLIYGRKRLSKIELLRVEYAESVDKDAAFKAYMQSLRSQKPNIPENLLGILREYQKDGVVWLTELSKLGMGGILADDMGLGKTLQALTFIRSANSDMPSLIIAPGTLVYNWQKETERFLPDMKYLIISGTKEERAALIEKSADYEIIITSYPLLRRDIALYKNIEFFCCITDEAQYIKNPKTMNAVSVKKIRALHRFALTGTPIENSVMELWSIFDFIMPGYLGTSGEFRARFEDSWDNSDVSSKLRNIIRPFVLRRMKRDVLAELPDKIETTVMSELTREQKVIYQAYAKRAREAAEMYRDGKSMTILTFLLRLRQICDHPSLVENKKDLRSGKLEHLLRLIEDMKSNGHRMVVFSQFRTMLEIIAAELGKYGYNYLTITGNVPMEERVKICERFNDGEGDIILVSLKSGGTGVNLTGADTVIHYDPWWNPAVTDQATDRAYRIGQTRTVNVIKLVSQGTIEEKILELESRKRFIADDIIRENTKTLKNLTDEEILSLFEL